MTKHNGLRSSDVPFGPTPPAEAPRHIYRNPAEGAAESLARWACLTYFVVLAPQYSIAFRSTTAEIPPHAINLTILLWIGASNPQALSSSIARSYFILFRLSHSHWRPKTLLRGS